VRDIVYHFALPLDTQEFPPSAYFDTAQHLIEAIGDPTGFYYNTRRGASMQLCKSLRAEMLPIAYENMKCEARDLDDAVIFLIAIGSLGRRSLGHLDFSWDSGIERTESWDSDCPEGLPSEDPDAEESPASWLPSLHVPLCLRLLADCRGLKTLTLRFEPDSLLEISLEQFQRNAGISRLASMKANSQVIILDTFGNSLDGQPHLQWLKREMISVNS
jgi:hypothetical protein